MALKHLFLSIKVELLALKTS